MIVEPMVVCRYATYPSSVVLADAAKLVEAVPAMGSVRIITELPEVLDAVRSWCAATGTVIVREDESRVLTVGGCIAEYEADPEESSGVSRMAGGFPVHAGLASVRVLTATRS